MERKVLILSAGIGSGHNSAASALEFVVRNQLEVDQVRTVDILESTPELYRSLYDDGYFKLVQSAPWLVGWGYDASDQPFRVGGSMPLWDQVNNTSTVRKIREFQPDLILCTHFLPARLVSLMQTWGAISTRMAIITTDYDFQGFWLSTTFSQLFLARAEAREHLIALGLPADRLAVTGIPIRHELNRPADTDAILERFRLRSDRPVLLVSAGAAGGDYASTIVEQLLRRDEQFQAVVVCGRNEDLRTEITRLVGTNTDRFRVLGYTTEMPELMRVADLFVGKPGGLSSSECMAAGLPMVLINPIPGQEVRNSDYLMEQGAAVRCNYDTTIGWKIGRLLGDPQRLERMAESARQTGRPGAALAVTSTMLKETGGQLWISDRAQRSILAASEHHSGSESLRPGRRLRTLVNAQTGRSVALITESQRKKLVRMIGKTPPDDPDRLVLASSDLRSLRSVRVDPFLLLTLHRVLGQRAEMTFEVR